MRLQKLSQSFEVCHIFTDNPTNVAEARLASAPGVGRGTKDRYLGQTPSIPQRYWSVGPFFWWLWWENYRGGRGNLSDSSICPRMLGSDRLGGLQRRTKEEEEESVFDFVQFCAQGEEGVLIQEDPEKEKEEEEGKSG